MGLTFNYLAPAIRDATADIDTIEERANRLLEQYVGQARSDRRVIVPLQSLLFIRRFATAERRGRGESARLIRRSLWRHAHTAGVAGLGGIALVTLLKKRSAVLAFKDRAWPTVSL
jgi:hypothetical protein